jgi:phosphonate dehydrogenase
MRKSKILITHWVHEEIINYLSEYGEVIVNPTRQSMDKGELLAQAKDADAIMAFMPDSIDEEFLSHCSKLKIVGAALKGYDNFDVDACTKKGVWFSIVPDHLTVPTAELAIGHLIAIGRNMQAGDRLIRNGHFPGWRPVLYGRGLAGSTIGILGMGEVGQTIARFLVPFSCSCLYYDTYKLEESRERELNAHSSPLEDIYRQSDFIVVALPLSLDTIHVIDKYALAQCKRGVYLVNIGRGSSVDEQAVAQALESGQLAGYAADVFEFEDWARPDRPQSIPAELTGRTDTTFFTPHIGSAVEGVRKDIAMEAAVNIVEALQGKRPHGAINSI